MITNYTTISKQMSTVIHTIKRCMDSPESIDESYLLCLNNMNLVSINSYGSQRFFAI